MEGVSDPKKGETAFCNCCESTFEPGELRIAPDWLNAKAPYRHIACLDFILPPPNEIQGLDSLPPEKQVEAINAITISRRRRGRKDGHQEPKLREASVVLPINQDEEFPAGCVGREGPPPTPKHD